MEKLKSLDVEGWIKVRRRRSITNRAITTLYVSNISDGFNYKDVWDIFMEFGKVIDVYIARKKDISGSNFAFIRFKGIKYIEELEMKTGNVKCRKCILKVNETRFLRSVMSTAKTSPFPL
ncbi:unnamed protein product [Lactuca saligna]|uniref:RRM domain-containing protein n=1 Tax=Lactuca saligna TaxID=75948 RepID=A0AA35Y4M5_LACSI|nr:unnamed protein product [Lactuca saligna]